ncbi:MAG: radical SAM protein [Phycisphaerae bacterium]
MSRTPVQLKVIAHDARTEVLNLKPLPEGAVFKVLFVYPNVQRTRTAQVGIAVLSACLKRMGGQTRLFDSTTLHRGHEMESFQRAVDEYQPDLLAYSVRSAEWSLVRELLALGKSRGIRQIAGGPHPTHAPEETIPHVDALVIGEGEGPITDIVRRLQAGESIAGIPNTWVNTPDGVVKSPKRDLIPDLDILPLPDWRLFDDIHHRHSYIRDVMGDYEVVAAIEGSRGCPFTCTYCSNSALMESYAGHGSWRREKSPQRIMEELTSFRDTFGSLDFVYWVDEIWLTGLERLKRFRDLYKPLIGAPFSIMERPECVTEEKIKVIADAGLYCICIGLETGDEDLRTRLLDRRTKLDVLRRAFTLPKRYGIKVHAFTMLGLPGQDAASLMKTWRFMRDIMPHSAQFTIFFPLKGTRLHDQVVQMGLYDGKGTVEDVYEGTVLRQECIDKKLVCRYRWLFQTYAIRPGWWPIIAFHVCRKVGLAYWLLFKAGPACSRAIRYQFGRLNNLRRCTPGVALRKIARNMVAVPGAAVSRLTRSLTPGR